MEVKPELPEFREPRTRQIKWLWWVIYALAVQVVVFAGVYFWFWSYAGAPGPLAAGQKREIIIPPGSSLARIQQILADREVITPDVRFKFLARKLGVDQRLRAGEYLFAGPVTPRQVLTKLAAGDVILHPVTIPEGVNIYQIADILAKNSHFTRQRFLELATEQKFVAETGLPGSTFEGYLFPDTYNFTTSQTEEDVIKMMTDRFGRVYNDLLKSLPARPALTRHEVVTLAAIVEKETGLAAERPLIAAVFLNRLQKGMYLQADPTVIYGLKKFDGNLTRRDLRDPTPYNTYRRKGLPAGPICNPGRESLAAVLQPAAENYLYFVSRNDGSHYFSKTLKEHNRAVYRFQKSATRRQKTEDRGQK